MTNENSTGQIGFEIVKPKIAQMIVKIKAGEFSINQFKDLPGLVFYQRDLSDYIAIVKPTWSTVSPQYKAAERKLAQKCMLSGLEYDMYCGWIDSLVWSDGKPFVRMPKGMYNMEMDKIGSFSGGYVGDMIPMPGLVPPPAM